MYQSDVRIFRCSQNDNNNSQQMGGILENTNEAIDYRLKNENSRETWLVIGGSEVRYR